METVAQIRGDISIYAWGKGRYSGKAEGGGKGRRKGRRQKAEGEKGKGGRQKGQEGSSYRVGTLRFAHRTWDNAEAPEFPRLSLWNCAVALPPDYPEPLQRQSLRLSNSRQSLGLRGECQKRSQTRRLSVMGGTKICGTQRHHPSHLPP